MLAGLLHQHFNRPMMKDKETSTENETAMNAMADDNPETAGNTDIADTTNADNNVADTTINAAVDAASDASTTDAMNAMAADNTETAGNTDIIDTTKAAKNVAATTINTAVDAASDANTTNAMTINADEDTHADVPTEHKEPDKEDKGKINMRRKKRMLTMTKRVWR